MQYIMLLLLCLYIILIYNVLIIIILYFIYSLHLKHFFWGGGCNFLKKWQKMIIAKQVGLCWKSELIFVEEFLREINKSFITGHADRFI